MVAMGRSLCIASVGYGSGVRFKFGVHGVGFSGDVGRSERATGHVRWQEGVLFIHRPSRVFYLHLAVRRSRRAVRLFRQFLSRERSDESNMSTRWFLLKCKLEKSAFYVLNGLAWIPLFLGVRVLVIPLMLKAFIFGSWNALSVGEKIVSVYHAADSEHVERLLGANDREERA